jgi:hypothetical protein
MSVSVSAVRHAARCLPAIVAAGALSALLALAAPRAVFAGGPPVVPLLSSAFLDLCRAGSDCAAASLRERSAVSGRGVATAYRPAPSLSRARS